MRENYVFYDLYEFVFFFFKLIEQIVLYYFLSVPDSLLILDLVNSKLKVFEDVQDRNV